MQFGLRIDAGFTPEFYQVCHTKKDYEEIDLAFVVTIQCLESCRKIDFIVLGVREVEKR